MFPRQLFFPHVCSSWIFPGSGAKQRDERNNKWNAEIVSILIRAHYSNIVLHMSIHCSSWPYDLYLNYVLPLLHVHIINPSFSMLGPLAWETLDRPYFLAYSYKTGNRQLSPLHFFLESTANAANPSLRWNLRIYAIPMSWKADLGSTWPFKFCTKCSVDLVSQHL